MKEHPILFSGPLVRALLREVDLKTMTRRLTQEARWNHRADSHLESVRPSWEVRGGPASTCNDWVATFVGGGTMPGGRWQRHGIACPYGAPGNRLWVRETWAPMAKSRDTRVAYRADMMVQNQTRRSGAQVDLVPWPVDNNKGRGYAVTRWTPSIHMPRWASRIDLEVTEVRVERLQDITEEDAKAEGVEHVSIADVPRQAAWSCRQDFSVLWDKINGGKAPWKSNPWVWVVSFKRVRP